MGNNQSQEFNQVCWTLGPVFLPPTPDYCPITVLYRQHSVFQTRKPRLREVKSLMQGHTGACDKLGGLRFQVPFHLVEPPCFPSSKGEVYTGESIPGSSLACFMRKRVTKGLLWPAASAHLKENTHLLPPIHNQFPQPKKCYLHIL